MRSVTTECIMAHLLVLAVLVHRLILLTVLQAYMEEVDWDHMVS